MRVTYSPVNSSNIAQIAYNEKLLYVEFTSGRRFAYRDVSLVEYADMKSAKSVGGYFAKNIKTKKSVAWNGWRCAATPVGLSGLQCVKDATLQGSVGAMIVHVCEECSKAQTQLGALTLRPYEGGK